MGVNSVSGEKLHDFEIICPARGVQTHPLSPPPPIAYGPELVPLLTTFVHGFKVLQTSTPE